MSTLLRRSTIAIAIAGCLALPVHSLAADTGGGTGTLGAGNSTTGLGGGTTGSGAPAHRPTAPDADGMGTPGVHQGGDDAADRRTGDTRDDGRHGGPHGAE
jgi:hypothetical protein